MMCLVPAIFCPSPHPVFGPRHNLKANPVWVSSMIVQADKKKRHQRKTYNFRQLKKYSPSSLSSLSKIEVNTYARARILFFYFLIFLFIKNTWTTWTKQELVHVLAWTITWTKCRLVGLYIYTRRFLMTQNRPGNIAVSVSSLEKLRSKYSNHSIQVKDPDPVIVGLDMADGPDQTSVAMVDKKGVTVLDWKDSAPVRRLSYFIKENSAAGFFLQQTRDGKPVLHFDPPLKMKEDDPDRWELAMDALFLFDEARDDLAGLIFNGGLTLTRSSQRFF